VVRGALGNVCSSTQQNAKAVLPLMCFIFPTYCSVWKPQWEDLGQISQSSAPLKLVNGKGELPESVF